jgi:adiponectin receptor
MLRLFTLLQVDIFLSELERRLDFLENYGELKLDASISRAFSTLQAVRARCSQVSEDMLGAGRRRVHIVVETLEARYHDALAAAESFNEKAGVGIELLDEMLTDFENRAQKLREQGLASAASAAGAAASAFLDEGRHVMHEGIDLAFRAAESLEEHIQRAIAQARVTKLIHYDELPIPWRINPHIRKGYRFIDNKVECVWSAFSISNELMNIWTHALGFLLVLSVALYFYPTSENFSLSTTSDIVIAACFFFTACLTLVCSTIWHTMNAVADFETVSLFACVDYTGISVLIAASIATTEYTVFYCDPVSRWIYMTATALLGIGGVILPWHPTFNGSDMAWVRVGFFVALAATGFLPIAQLYVTHGGGFVRDFYSPIVQSLVVYLSGACVYASKIPERWYPGMFDYVGGSHNLWHVAVLGGILFHYTAMQQFFSTAFARAEGGCPAY